MGVDQLEAAEISGDVLGSDDYMWGFDSVYHITAVIDYDMTDTDLMSSKIEKTTT
jgi:hypothetical protein